MMRKKELNLLQRTLLQQIRQMDNNLNNNSDRKKIPIGLKTVSYLLENAIRIQMYGLKKHYQVSLLRLATDYLTHLMTATT